MPRFGLAAKLAGCLIGGVLLYSACFAYFQQRLEQRHLETLVNISAVRVAEIVRSSARHAMMENDRERLYTQIRDLGREPGIRLLRIISEEGLVRHSTEASEIGRVVDKNAEACYGCHAQSQPLTALNAKDRTRTFLEKNGSRTLAVILPIENSPDCSNAACHAHPASRKILGVIDAHLALDAVDGQLLEHRAQMMGFTVAAALVVTLSGVGFVFIFVYRPVRELIYGTLKFARGEMAYRIHVESSDELGLLAQSLNHMAEELSQAYSQLQEWARRLEERVREKTAELETAHKGMIQSEKLVSLGKLAATVAHEVNNPLFGMLTYARLTMKEVGKAGLSPEATARVTEYQQIIERESKRCGELMKNLLAFARQAPPQQSVTQLNVVADRARALMTHQYELAQIELRMDLDPALPETYCDAGQMQQVLIILLANACDAIGRGGSVTLGTRALPGGEGVLLSVRDNGPGISEEIQSQIFEPFFSTKDDQHRTGLGLAVARGIVERHGGTITVESVPGQGAEFRVRLPLPAAQPTVLGHAKETI